MINVIGTKRSLILISLALLNAAVGGLGYYYIMPEEENSTKRLRTIRGEVSTVRADLEKIRIEFEQLGVQQSDFNTLKEQGFFKPQNRNEARALFQVIQAESGVISAVVSIKPGTIEENEEAQKAKHKILSSRIEIDIKAFDDTNVYKYILLAQKNFLGDLSVDSVDIQRTGEVTPEVLRAILTGSNPDMITAKVVMIWRTMIPEAQIISDQGTE